MPQLYSLLYRPSASNSTPWVAYFNHQLTWLRKYDFNWFPQTLICEKSVWKKNINLKWVCHIKEVNKSNGFSSLFFWWWLNSKLGGWEDYQQEKEQSRKKRSGRESVIIEQESCAAVLKSHAGPRSHQKCNDSKRQNMIFNWHWMGPSGNEWEDTSTAKRDNYCQRL